MKTLYALSMFIGLLGFNTGAYAGVDKITVRGGTTPFERRYTELSVSGGTAEFFEAALQGSSQIQCNSKVGKAKMCKVQTLSIVERIGGLVQFHGLSADLFDVVPEHISQYAYGSELERAGIIQTNVQTRCAGGYSGTCVVTSFVIAINDRKLDIN